MDLHQLLFNLFLQYLTKLATPQDLHKRLVLQFLPRLEHFRVQ